MHNHDRTVHLCRCPLTARPLTLLFRYNDTVTSQHECPELMMNLCCFTYVAHTGLDAVYPDIKTTSLLSSTCPCSTCFPGCLFQITICCLTPPIDPFLLAGVCETNYIPVVWPLSLQFQTLCSRHFCCVTSSASRCRQILVNLSCVSVCVKTNNVYSEVERSSNNLLSIN